jgi:hypothetical protein
MAGSASKGVLPVDGEHNPWAPPTPDLLSDEPSPEEVPTEPLEQPPQYSDAHQQRTTAFVSNVTSRSPLPSPKIPLQHYRIPESRISADRGVSTTKSISLCNESDSLFTFLKDQIALPPKPVLHIVGNHKTYSSYEAITDFDLKLNLTSLLWRPDGQQWNYLKFPPPSQHPVAQSSSTRDAKRKPQIPSRSHEPPQDLPTLSHAFTTDPAPSRSLTVTRTTANLDTSYLHGQVLALLAQAKYAGTVSVTFPNTYASVVVQKGTPLGQTWKTVLNTAASWVTLGKAPAMPTSYKVDVIWPFATSASHSPGQGAEERKCAVQSEVEWWATWQAAIRNGVLAGKKGWISSDDWTEATMGWREEEKKEEWGANDAGYGGR